MPPPAQKDHRLRHGLVLSKVNVKDIGLAVEETDMCLGQVRRELRALKQTVEALEAVESTLQRTLIAQRTYVAPVRRLPVELLATIFEWACHDSPVGIYKCAALEISLVCKRWREVMYASPVVWLGLRLPASEDVDWRRNCKPWLRRIQICLQATRGLPLVQPLRISSQAKQAGPCFLSVIRSYSNQLQSLQITGRNVPSPSPLLNGYSFAHLHALEIDTEALIAGIDPDHFASAPVRTLTLYNRGHLDVVPRFPWSRLDELHTKCSHIYALKVLAKCTNVVRWFHNDKIALDEEGAPAPVTLPHLQVLHIYNIGIGTGDSRTLDFVTAPMLQILRLCWDCKSTNNARPCVSALLARSDCRLQELMLQQSPASELRDLSSMPELRTLSLDYPKDSPFTDADISMLAAVGDDHKPAILPRLEELSVGGFGHYRGQAVVDMVTARRSAGRPLRALDLDLFSIDMEYFGSLSALDRLRDLVPEFIGPE